MGLRARLGRTAARRLIPVQIYDGRLVLLVMRLFFFSDCHLSDRPPAHRTQRYADEIFDKLEECREIAKSVDLSIFGGDLFHAMRPRDTSHALVRRTIEFFRDWPGICLFLAGNHDVPAEQLVGLQRMPLGVVLEAMDARLIRLLHNETYMGVHFEAVHWTSEADTDPSVYRMTSPVALPSGPHAGANVKVVHAMCIPPGQYPFPCVTMDQIETEADLVLIGHCVAYITPVDLAGGGTRCMGSIVGQREPHIVKSLDLRTMKITEMPVTNWHRRQVSGNWRHLQLRRGRPGLGPKGRGVFLTSDHPVLTPSGWRRADAIRSGDRVVTSEPMPSAQQFEVLTGTLLGDGSLVQRRQGRATLAILQGQVQEQWGALKVAALSGLGLRRQKSRWCRWESRLAAWGELTERWYRSGHKDVPDDLHSDELTPLCLATWFGDDGNLHKGSARLATAGFSGAGRERLAWLLEEKGWRFHVGTQGELRCRTADSVGFFEEIAPYLPPCLRHKLPIGSAAFDPSRWELQTPTFFVDEVLVTVASPARSQNWAYCIDVPETENFIAGGLVLHNCHWKTPLSEYNGTVFVGPGAIARTAHTADVGDDVSVAIVTFGAGRPEIELRRLERVRPAHEVFVWMEGAEVQRVGLFEGYVAVLEAGLDVGGLSVEDALAQLEHQAPVGVVERAREYLREAGL